MRVRKLRAEQLEVRTVLTGMSVVPPIEIPPQDPPLIEAPPATTPPVGVGPLEGVPTSELPPEDAGPPDGLPDGPPDIGVSDVVLDWNNLFNTLLVANEANQNPGYASRSMAMLNLAIYDAVTITSGNTDNAFYDYDNLDQDIPVRAEVVASQAAYTVLSSLYPDQQTTIHAFLDDMRTGSSPNPITAASIALGTEIGNANVAARATDGSDSIVDYTYTDKLGYFQPDPLNPEVPVWGPGWGQVDTFAISSPESYAPVTTPPLTSAEYAASYNEVKELGSVDSELRTANQTEAGIFWAYDRVGLGTPLALYNNVLETIAVQEGNTFEENAALFAQASVAMADAAVVAWHTKFSEEFWRPVTAIRQGDLDGNEDTAGDAEWTPLGAPDGGDDIVGFTPQFPTYISGHATFGGALFGSLQQFYGTDDIAFALTSKELEILLNNDDLQEAYGLDLDDAQRSFGSLSEAMAENGRSRVYLGIHFDFDDLVGQEVGQAVAESVSSEFIVNSNAVGNHRGGPGADGLLAAIETLFLDPMNEANGDESDASILSTDSFELSRARAEYGSPAGFMRDADLNLLALDRVNRQRDNQSDRDRDRTDDDQHEAVWVELLDSVNLP